MSAPLRKRVPVHSATGKKWKSHPTIKKHLRQDFNGRCAYCDDSDSLVDVDFQVEHFAPMAKFPEREIVYENLLYACPYCNKSKSKYWVSDDPDISVIGDQGVVNPCDKAYDRHLGRLETGCIYPKTPLGEFMYRRLKLYLRRHELFFSIERLKNKIKELKAAGAGADIWPMCDQLNEYYSLSPIVKWQKGEVLECPVGEKALKKKAIGKKRARCNGKKKIKRN